MSGLGQNIHLLHCAVAGAVQAAGGWAAGKGEATGHLQGHCFQKGRGQPGCHTGQGVGDGDVETCEKYSNGEIHTIHTNYIRVNRIFLLMQKQFFILWLVKVISIDILWVCKRSQK